MFHRWKPPFRGAFSFYCTPKEKFLQKRWQHEKHKIGKRFFEKNDEKKGKRRDFLTEIV
ncbi:hypothetical protein [Selenomonas sp. GACV-9]|uniref:hypothetical protein n=1 Tax=Selenomonas sp. GACV-9 TaxID=3158782 RepID=UPI0015A5FB1C